MEEAIQHQAISSDSCTSMQKNESLVQMNKVKDMSLNDSQETTLNKIKVISKKTSQVTKVSKFSTQQHNDGSIAAVHPHYSCARFLSDVKIHFPGKASLNCQKVNSFPYSKFEITDLNELTQKMQIFSLESNFTGSLYNLTNCNDDILLTISFVNEEKSCSRPFRTFELYYLKPQFSYRDLVYNNMGKGLHALYTLEENVKKIIKLTNKHPEWSLEKQCYRISFKSKGTVASVKNSIVIDQQGSQVFEMTKKIDRSYQIKIEQDVLPAECLCAFAAASLDFKLYTE